MNANGHFALVALELVRFTMTRERLLVEATSQSQIIDADMTAILAAQSIWYDLEENAEIFLVDSVKMEKREKCKMERKLWK